MQVKNIVTISLTVFIVLVVIILGAGVYFNQAKPAQNQQQNNTTTITLADVSKHNSSSDCWVVVSDKVYNATNIIPTHPAGPEKIIPLCGKDATQAFTTRGGFGPHPEKSQNVLKTYYVGDITR